MVFLAQEEEEMNRYMKIEDFEREKQKKIEKKI